MQVSMNRRFFLKLLSLSSIAAATGVIFSCKSKEKPTVSGSGRIDVHHHILPPDYVTALKRIGITESGGVPFPDWNPQTSLNVMDQNEIAAAITSISSPGVYFGDISFSRDLARRCNEFSARLVSDYPQRFGSLAVLPLPDVDAALKELEYAIDTLKLDGIVLLTNVGGHYLGDPEFDELFSELNRRKAVVFIHPTDPPGENLPKLKVPSSLVEFVFDTTRAVVNLIHSGTIERYPNIRFIVAHAGGTAPYLAWRISLFEFKPGMYQQDPQEIIHSSLKCLYYDIALSASPHALSSLKQLADPSHILFGSDYPFAPEILTAWTIEGLRNYAAFDEKARLQIERENALKLFPKCSKA